MGKIQNRAAWSNSGHTFWVMQEGKSVWIVESASKPDQTSKPGGPSRVILHSAASRSDAEELAKRATNGTGYTLVQAPK